MDLMRLLRSLEEFLYELVGWLVFYPRTLWRIVTRPDAVARYTLRELEQPEEEQFTETISPVLMLILSVVLAHAVELASRTPLPQFDTPAGRLLFGSEQGLLLTRSVLFCAYALVAALITLRRQQRPITRGSLRGPFSVQSFLVSPFVLAVSFALVLVRQPGDGPMFGAALLASGCLWYLWARIRAYHAVARGHWLATFAFVLGGFIATTALIVAVAIVVVG